MSRKQYVFLTLLIVLVLPLLYPLFKAGFPITDDADWFIIRFTAFYQALVQGHFPVRWLGRLNFNYGYPVANFNYPAYMYGAVLPKLLGFGFVVSIKLVLGVSMVSASVFTFLWLKSMFNRTCALVGASVYIYHPYILFDLYQRGSIGEIVALGVVPFVFWSIERKSRLWTAIGLAILITSHNILAVLFFPVLIAYMHVRSQFNKRDLALSVLVGLGLAAFFWLPAIYDLQYTVFTNTTVSVWMDHFADIKLFGYLNIVILLLSLGIVFRHRAKLSVLSWGLVAFGFFLSTSLSNLVWKILPVTFVQFPFRMLVVTIPGLALLAAYIIYRLPSKLKIGVGTVLIILQLIVAIPVLTAVEIVDKGEGFYATNESSSTIKNEYMPIWVEQDFMTHAEQKVQLIDGGGELIPVQEKGHLIEFKANLDVPSTVEINSIYFPGWIARLDSKEIDILVSEKGTMNIEIPTGQHQVEVVFQETTLRMIANLISITTLFVIVILQFKLWKKS